MIKRILGSIIPVGIKKQIINFKILSIDYAQFRSIKKWDCVNSHGDKIPWYTYPSIEYLDNLDFSGKSVFEFGSGNSSSYWSKKSKEVISVEHDKEWFDKVNQSSDSNQKFLYRERNTSYEKSVGEYDSKYDVIIIDGARRTQCAREIYPFLNVGSPDGYMVILDNSDWYQDTAKYLREELDLIEIDFHGFGPINNYTWTTSIFISRNFRFKPIENIQPKISISGIKQSGEFDD